LNCGMGRELWLLRLVMLAVLAGVRRDGVRGMAGTRAAERLARVGVAAWPGSSRST
jgi:hypothetical protein